MHDGLLVLNKVSYLPVSPHWNEVAANQAHIAQALNESVSYDDPRQAEIHGPNGEKRSGNP